MFSKRFNFMTIAGIKIGIDLSWLFIAILLSWTLAAGHFPFAYPGHSIGLYWFMGVLGMLGLFACIVLHELGHAFVAKHFKLPISQITLFLFGGVAEIKKEPTSPKVEFLVAIAGPIVTLALTFLLFFTTYFGTQFGWSFILIGITSYLTTINLLILFFNLVPAFPLDGGRILRSLLWKWKGDLAWATKITTNFGLGFGFFLIFFGIFSFIGGNLIGGMWLAIIGLFIQKAATASRTQVYINKELENEKVLKFMTREVETVSSESTILEVLQQHVYKSHHHLYPVVDQNQLLGYVSLAEIKTVPQDQWNQIKIASVMIPLNKCVVASPEMSALNALSLMEEAPTPALLVTDGSRLIGLLTSRDLFRVISLKLELGDDRKKE